MERKSSETMKLAYLPLLVTGCMPKADIPLPAINEAYVESAVKLGENPQDAIQRELDRITTVMDFLGKRRGETVRMFLPDRENECAYSATWNDSDQRGLWDSNDTLELTVNCRDEIVAGSYDTDSNGREDWEKDYRVLFDAIEKGFRSSEYRSRIWAEVVDDGNRIRVLLREIESDVNVRNLERFVSEQEARKKRMEKMGVKYDASAAPQFNPELGLTWSYGSTNVAVKNSQIRLDIRTEEGSLAMTDENYVDTNSIFLSATSGEDSCAFIDTRFRFQVGNVSDPIQMMTVYKVALPILEDFVKENIRKS